MYIKLVLFKQLESKKNYSVFGSYKFYLENACAYLTNKAVKTHFFKTKTYRVSHLEFYEILVFSVTKKEKRVFNARKR